jgi:hypothetical protein
MAGSVLLEEILLRCVCAEARRIRKGRQAGAVVGGARTVFLGGGGNAAAAACSDSYDFLFSKKSSFLQALAESSQPLAKAAAEHAEVANTRTSLFMSLLSTYVSLMARQKLMAEEIFSLVDEITAAERAAPASDGSAGSPLQLVPDAVVQALVERCIKSFQGDPSSRETSRSSTGAGPAAATDTSAGGSSDAANVPLLQPNGRGD